MKAIIAIIVIEYIVVSIIYIGYRFNRYNCIAKYKRDYIFIVNPDKQAENRNE